MELEAEHLAAEIRQLGDGRVGCVLEIQQLDEGRGRQSDAHGKSVVAKMKDMPTDDALFGRGVIRADGARSSPRSPTVERGRVGANPGGRLLIGTICARFRSNGAFIL